MQFYVTFAYVWVHRVFIYPALLCQVESFLRFPCYKHMVLQLFCTACTLKEFHVTSAAVKVLCGISFTLLYFIKFKGIRFSLL